jgi:hypothetical protein
MVRYIVVVVSYVTQKTFYNWERFQFEAFCSFNLCQDQYITWTLLHLNRKVFYKIILNMILFNQFIYIIFSSIQKGAFYCLHLIFN